MSWLLLDGYGAYVWISYGATAVILGWLVWSTLSANRQARSELERFERGRTR